ncbi:MAG: InlB B-repeat-containing protein [Clostridia bacterium]|nr:InlB B-repeat-containing protein [Clostridia bacterium]
MKKTFALIITVFILATALPLFTFADVSASRIDVCEAIAQGLRERQEAIDVSQYLISADDIVDYYYFAQFLAPSAFDVGGSIKYTTTSAPTGRVVASIKPAYTMTDAEYAQAKLFYDGEIEKIIALVPQGLGEYETALLLHDYICATYKYSEPGAYVYDAYSILSGGAGVCEAYTKLYTALLSAFGITSYPVSSSQINHVWNEVRLDGRWFLVDVTWGDPVPDSPGNARHNDFLGSTALFTSDHGTEFTPVYAADDTSLDTADFRQINLPFAYLNGEAYGCADGVIGKYDISAGTSTEICTVGSSWPAGTEGSYWVNKFSGVAAFGEQLIYNSADSFWTLDPFSGAEEKIYTPELDPSLSIYGCYNFGDTLYYITAAKSNPNSGVSLHTLRFSEIFGEPEYTVSFLNWDGSVISEKSYHIGDEIELPEDPTRPDDETYTYTFSGWDTAPSAACEGEATYIATYTEAYIDYTVKFLNWDESVISEKTCHYGDGIELPEDPARPDDETYTYTFSGWDKTPGLTCSGSATYTAVYTAAYIDYTVKFLNWDGSVISEKTYHYGDEVEIPADPARPGDGVNEYVFAGWDKEITACAGTAEYTATYMLKEDACTVTFLDWDGALLSSAVYRRGETPAAPADPERAADRTYTYVFTGWDKEIVPAEGDAEYRAVYEGTYINYTVKFLNWDGSVISEKACHYGDMVEIPADPARPDDGDYTYTFTGWDKEITVCEGDAAYTAVYESAPKQAAYMRGDVNGNGKIDAADYAMCKRAFLKTFTLNEDQLLRADINGNGKVDASEYAMIKLHFLGTYKIPQPGDAA